MLITHNTDDRKCYVNVTVKGLRANNIMDFIDDLFGEEVQ